MLWVSTNPFILRVKSLTVYGLRLFEEIWVPKSRNWRANISGLKS